MSTKMLGHNFRTVQYYIPEDHKHYNGDDSGDDIDDSNNTSTVDGDNNDDDCGDHGGCGSGADVDG